MEVSASELDILALWMEPYNDRLYRVTVVDDKTVRVTPFVSVTGRKVETYTLGTDPMWITERLAALHILPNPPPPQKVEGVGMRVDDRTFWIIAPETV